MTTTQDHDEYLTQLHRCAQQILKHRNAPNAEDVASNVVLTASTHGPDLMDRYPAKKYARIRSRHALVEFDRSERAQRGQGTRLRRLPDGTVEPMRKVVPLAIDYDNNPNVCVPGDPEEHLFASDLYGRMKAVVGEQLAKAFYDIAIQDRPVKAIAAELGIRPETLSRKLNECRRTLREHLMPTGELLPV